MKRKEINTLNGQIIRPFGNAKKLYENSKGEYYFNWSGKRYYTYNILRIMGSCDKIAYKKDDKYHVICGYIALSYIEGLYVELGTNDNGDYYIQFYEPVESEV